MTVVGFWGMEKGSADKLGGERNVISKELVMALFTLLAQHFYLQHLKTKGQSFIFWNFSLFNWVFLKSWWLSETHRREIWSGTMCRWGIYYNSEYKRAHANFEGDPYFPSN